MTVIAPPRPLRDLRLLFAGAAASKLGIEAGSFALPLVAVIALDASPGQVGLLATLTTAAFLLIGLPAGVWVDRARRRGIMIRQGTYHTARFGDRFVKISTSVPGEWAEKLCTLLPGMVEEARSLNDLPPQF